MIKQRASGLRVSAIVPVVYKREGQLKFVKKIKIKFVNRDQYMHHPCASCSEVTV